MEDRRKNLEDRRKRARDRRKNSEILKSIATLLFRTAVMLLLILIIWNLSDIKIMLTDILNQQNTIVVELDKQSIDDAAENRSGGELEALTGEAREIVERVVAAESRGEDLQGMMAVAQVIKDRSDLWDMHPVDVVQAEGQFAKPYQGEISDEIHLAVANVFDGGMRVFQEPTTHFHSGAEPYWTENKVNRGSVGNHRFYY
jgi:spore germination cell wall hydrolase CwlJ-like protein